MDSNTRETSVVELLCPTCSARYPMPKYVEGQRYGCTKCGASLLFGKFALLRELGRGGFGVVYKAYQLDLQRVVALKFLHSDSPESTERFIREARIAAQLNHPNIAAIHDVGQHEGRLFISMQFVDGQTAHKIDLPIRDAVTVIRDTALAVDYAHAREIVHRDIKPHNIMVAQERSGTHSAEMSRRVYVMDFGLARSVNRDSSLTVEGQVIGTPSFMSPEQAEGRAVDLRSDVYSLGATLYSLVTRRVPFEGPTPVQVLMMVAKGNLVPPSRVNPEIDPGLEAIILMAMALRPEERYPTAGRLASDLSLWLQGMTPSAGPTIQLSATPSGVTAPTVRRVKARRGLAAAVVAALLVAAGGIVAVKLLPGAPAPVEREKPPGIPVSVAPPVPEPPPPKPVPEKPAKVVAFTVDSEPRPARVLLNGVDSGETPLTVYRDDVAGDDVRVVVERAGYETIQRRVGVQGPRQDLVLKLEPQTGSVRVRGAAPGSTLHLFAIPRGVKNISALLGLWSENAEALAETLDRLDPADAALAAERLREISATGEKRLRARAAALAAIAPAAAAARPEQTLRADGAGNAIFPKVSIANRYCVVATSPSSRDFVSGEIQPIHREESSVEVEAALVGSLSVLPRPAAGRFTVKPADGSAARSLASDGTPIQLVRGKVTLDYVPPGNDPLLRAFSLSVSLGESFELSANLYWYSARQAERDGDVEAAVRGFTRVVAEEDASIPEGERRTMPEKMRGLVRGRIEGAVSREIAGDLAVKVAEARKGQPAELLGPLLELYAARGASREVKGAAAAALAHARARLRHPYEAMEWLERAAREGVDPGREIEDAVAAAIKGFPGLAPERWEPVAKSLAALRVVVEKKPDPVVPAPAPGRVGVLQLVRDDIGIIVRLEEGAKVAAGDLLAVVREGEVVDEIAVEQVLAPDKNYAHGSARCLRGKGQARRGDEARKK